MTNAGSTTTTTRQDAAPVAAPATASAPPAVRTREYGISRPAVMALRRDDVDGFLLAEFGEAVREYDPGRLSELRRLTHHLLAMRKENVAGIGDDEMFKVSLPGGGQLVRVTHKVQLSVARKEVFQVPKKRQDELGNWVNSVAEPGIAQLTVPGYDAINRVVGCSVALPPTIKIDGNDRENPYVERYPDTGTTTGDIRRIVICVVVAGMSQIGTPVVVRYTYEYEPGKELLHALGRLSTETDYKTKKRKHEGIVELVAHDEFAAFVQSQTDKWARWKFVPMFGGVGYACNLADQHVAAVYYDMLQVSKEAGKKAITVARRNAMRAHPALSRGAIEIDQKTGLGFTTVTGWTASKGAVRDYNSMMADLARGVHDHIADVGGVEIIEKSEAYDPAGETIDAVDEDDLAQAAASAEEEELNEVQLAVERRGTLIASIHDAAARLSPNDAELATFALGDLTLDELQIRLDETLSRG